ncbi:MAG: peptidylprolyl isomerase [Aestuariivirga sp.]|uniref:peptidylprolyl isomerase n=1 Tax=Aestuariivirga sp. TaxID=2650926 RepID=UPI0025C08620|nr:peptidylprolyl isomerase [Aestuariivirga sp.]MCA3560347.1 peptidylprolyl isomerase [Aestuariivirga sp.]
MSFFRNLLTSCAAAALLGLCVAMPALAQEDAAPKDDKVIAIVNGHEIRVSEVQMATDDIIGQLPDMPPKLRYPFVVEYLIERHLLAQYAVQEGIAETEEYKRRLALYQAKALRDAYFFQKIRPMVTEDMIRKAYDEEAAKLQQTERVRARMILVASEKEAQDIEKMLADGQKFEDLAKKYSLDGSKDYGGDLGYFTAAEMVPEFSKATFALKVGETSQPVKTDFGWHIIRLEDRKQGAAQPYDQVKQAIRNVLLRQKVGEVMAKIREKSKVEILDDDLKKYAEEAAKAAKNFQENKPALDESGGAAPAAGGDAMGGDNAAGDAASGKGDLQIQTPQ